MEFKGKNKYKRGLPHLNDANSLGQAIGRFLRDKKVWQQLKEEALAEIQQCVPFSFRHRYSYVGQKRQKDYGTYKASKQKSDTMSHSLDDHLVSYARFMT